MSQSVKRRLAFVIAHLGPGGAQRVMATAANAMAERDIEVHLITVQAEPPDAYRVDPRVIRHLPPPVAAGVSSAEVPTHRSLMRRAGGLMRRGGGLIVRHTLRHPVMNLPRGALRYGLNLNRRAHWLRRVIRMIGPDAVLSFLTQTNILTIAATRGTGVHTVISERNDLRLQLPRRRVAALRRVLYRYSDVVTANSTGAVDSMRAFVPKHKLAFLPNPLRQSAPCEAVTFAGPTFITVTRLVEQKGVDILLKAAAEAFEQLPNWRLAVIGDGPLRKAYVALATELRITEFVDWIGQVPDPTPYLRAAQVFVLASRFEGSPNALLEAMALGLPSIVSDASPGPLELVGSEEAGLIVPVEDVSATAGAMIKLARDDDLCRRLGEAAIKRTSIHQLDRAMDIWLDLLNLNVQCVSPLSSQQ